jgi:alpha-glucosidase
MSLSGFYFYGNDLGGFSGNMPSPELLLRWLQLGLFEPRFTIHSWNEDGSATMPWSYPDILPSVKALFAQRKQLLPYLYNCAYNAVENDAPINAPLFLYYNDDINLNSNSFMLGRDILATCIFEQGEEAVNVALPKKDNWYLGDKLFFGGQQVKLNIPPTAKMPYFVRSGSVIPTNEAEYGFNDNEKLVLTVYPLVQGDFDAQFFYDDGVSFNYKNGDCVMLKLHIECNQNEVVVNVSNQGNMAFDGEFALCSADKRKLIVK